MTVPSPVPVRYYPATGAARAVPGELSLGAPGKLQLRLTDDGTVRELPAGALRSSERFASATRHVQLPDGAVIEVDDALGLSHLLAAAGQPERAVTRWQQSWRAVALATVLSALALGAAWQWVLPWAADRSAAWIPVTWTQALDRAVIAQLKATEGLQPSALSDAEQARLRARFHQVLAAAGQTTAVEIHFFRMGDTPNAFALPGGSMVFLDGLVKRAPDDDALIGVFAHEFGHVQHRHGLRTLLRTAAITAVATWYFGDFTSLANAAILTTQLRYSRGFESEADDTALAIMRAVHANPKSLAELFRRMRDGHADESPARDSQPVADKANAKRKSLSIPEFLNTHPDIERRIERFERAQ
ncbi:MAG: M48 family metallopeptidase [Burkholderiales bacterium]|nr:M48 family metallopeptidase [Burkholderiales bacterium]